MKTFTLFAILMCSTILVYAQGKETDTDSGKLLAFSEGKQIGAETFTISNGSVGEGNGSLTVNGQTLNLKSRTEYSGTHAVAFSLEVGNMKLQVSFNGTEAKMTGAQEAAAQTDPESLILENNVGYQYYFLIHRYDKRKGGVQQFKMFVPSIMQTLPVSLEMKGTVTPLPDKAAKLEHYRAILAGSVNIDILTDSSGRLVFMGPHGQKSETVREEYASSIEQLRAGMASVPASAGIDYSAPQDAPFTAEEVTIKANGYTLAGTLLLPKRGARPFPAVLTITGSGQQTRDEPIPISGLEKYKPMRQIAESLASRGIAVLRVDDRGVGQSGGGDTIPSATTSGYADDARAEIAYLRSRPEIDPKRIALVGHSEGGIIAPMIASTDPQVAAIVLMAGSGKTGAQITMDQLNDALEREPNMTAEAKEQQRALQQEIIRAVASGGDLSKYPAQVRLPWVKEFWAYDPLPTVRKVRQPVLIMQGALDRQITAEQAGMLEQAAKGGGNKDVTVQLFPTLNHLFLPARTGAFSEYSTLEKTTIGDDVLKILGDWLEAKLKTRKP